MGCDGGGDGDGDTSLFNCEHLFPNCAATVATFSPVFVCVFAFDLYARTPCSAPRRAIIIGHCAMPPMIYPF